MKQRLTAQAVKDEVCRLGADLCGIASEASFAGAPAGFHPRDIWSETRSVIVFAKRLPVTSIDAENIVPYTYVNQVLTQMVDDLTIRICLWLESHALRAVPIPSDDPYLHWEPELERGQAILSLRHAGQLAGLGVLGRNTLLWNQRLGNMLQVGAVLTDQMLEADKPAQYRHCPSECRICLDACPAEALDGQTVDQKLCRPLSNYVSEKGFVLKKCSRCRSSCPRRFGG